ncbi:hypothetical protein [Parasediminibacterium sp. JCM 36343]|uniref:hypothetical protein n=1 Tax=Parasediminibacterium sp. JCM 36343 TaxID=3374279 RepID=UPI003978009A
MHPHTSTLLLPLPKHSCTPKESLINAWGVYLETFSWQYYCTFTALKPMSLTLARSAMTSFYEALNKQFAPVTIFWVAEPFDTTYGYHTHALIDLSLPVSKKTESTIKKNWSNTIGGKSTKFYNRTLIMPYVKQWGANFYLSKYLHRHSSDHDLFI